MPQIPQLPQARQFPIARILGGIAVALGAAILLLGSWYTVDQRDRGVILRNGAVVGTAQPGLGFKLPLIDQVVDISVQTNTTAFEEMSAYSYDQQEAMLRVSVNWRAVEKDVTEVYSQYGSLKGVEDRLISPRVNQMTKVVFGRYVAVTAIQDRGRLNSEILQAIVDATKDAPVVIDSVQLENIDFSRAYVASIEQRMLAEVEVQKLRQNAEREKVSAQITVTQAQAQADAALATAQAQATAIRLQGEATAAAIKARGDALKANPDLVALTTAERWDGRLPKTMVPGSGVPLLSLR